VNFLFCYIRVTAANKETPNKSSTNATPKQNEQPKRMSGCFLFSVFFLSFSVQDSPGYFVL